MYKKGYITQKMLIILKNYVDLIAEQSICSMDHLDFVQAPELRGLRSGKV